MRDRNIEENTSGAINRRLRAIEQAASGVVMAVEALRAAVRQAEDAIQEALRHEIARRSVVSPPSPVLPSVAASRPRLLRVKEVASFCGLSRATIWRLRRSGEFPPCYRVTAHTVVWRAEEIDGWIQSRRSTKG
jgi:prophage regulatory protein